MKPLTATTGDFTRRAVGSFLAAACAAALAFTSPEPARAGCFTSASTGADTFAATFDSCNAGGAVTTRIEDRVVGQRFNIRFGQRAQSEANLGPVYSGQRERGLDQPLYVWGTRPKAVPVVAYFEYQTCYDSATFSRYICTPWKAIQIDLGYNELKDYR